MTQNIYTIDAETDPFRFGRVPRPFALGFYDGSKYSDSWTIESGNKAVDAMREQIFYTAPGIIYAHNGGRFDFFLFMDWFVNNPMRIINGRIVKAKMRCATGWHELRDSYAIMPFPLKKALGKTRKKDIEIDKLEPEFRAKHMPEILSYLKADCISLWELCVDFIDEFGPMLTIGSTAMKELKKVHSFDTIDQKQDLAIDHRTGNPLPCMDVCCNESNRLHSGLRPHYYYGGRVQAFKKGVLEGAWKVYDVNSMYPSVMKQALHPIGPISSEGTTVRESTCFVSARGWNHGAFPVRVKGGGISFEQEYGVFHVTIHEWNMAEELGLFKPEKILRCVNFDRRSTFEEFVEMGYTNRINYNLAGQLNKGLFWKRILNSAYGKFSQNPDNYKEYCITDAKTDLHEEGYRPEEIKYGTYIVWSKRGRDSSRYNVATGASITGASRAILLSGIARSKNPIYCDTDSIVCEAVGPELEQHATNLGAWKLEAEATTACIGGKKLYALFDTNQDRNARRIAEAEKDGKKLKVEKDGSICVKQANKGVKVTAAQIRSVAEGQVVQTQRDAPSFKLNGTHIWIKRKVRMT
jgi:NOL1/NOP2/fmu family ribosome biogenesis protein